MADEQTLIVSPHSSGFGAEVRGVDLAHGLTPLIAVALRRAWLDHGVIWCPGQRLDPAALERVSCAFGAFGHDPYVGPMDGFDHVIEVKREPRETAPVFGASWHSDWSFQATPPSATVLYGAEIPPRGGDTVFADTARAWADLSPRMQDLLRPLRALHSAAPAYGPGGLFARDDASRSMRIIVSADADAVEVHPLVRRLPDSGREALFVNHVYTVGIEGMRADESAALLDFLCRHMTRADYLYRHRWQPDTLLVWDNRRAIHYAEGGYAGHRRLMYRTTVAGERPQAA